MSDRLLGAVEPEVAEVLRGVPAAWLEQLGPEDVSLLSPSVAAVLGRAAKELDGPPTSTLWQVLVDRCVPGTPYAGIRMELPYAGVCAVASPGTSSAWFPWLPIGLLCDQPASGPLLLVVHDVDRRALDLRDVLGPWAEGAGCFLLAPEFLVDPREPDADLAYATGPRAAQDALALVDELSASVGVSFQQVLVLAFGTGAALLPALLRVAPERLLGGVLVSPDAASVLPALAAEPLPEAAGSVPLVVLAGTDDIARPVDGSAERSGLGDARRTVAAGGQAGLDVRLELVPGSGGEVLHSPADAVVVGSLRPTAVMHAATAAVAGLLAAGRGVDSRLDPAGDQAS